MNQHPALTALHITFLRQHNKIVNELKAINPHWGGERLYQEAKYVVLSKVPLSSLFFTAFETLDLGLSHALLTIFLPYF